MGKLPSELDGEDWERLEKIFIVLGEGDNYQAEKIKEQKEDGEKQKNMDMHSRRATAIANRPRHAN